VGTTLFSSNGGYLKKRGHNILKIFLTELHSWEIRRGRTKALQSAETSRDRGLDIKGMGILFLSD